MNARRIAALLRERAQLDLELAAAFEDDADAPANDAPAPPVRRRRTRRLVAVKPTGKVRPTETDIARAERLIERSYGRRG